MAPTKTSRLLRLAAAAEAALDDAPPAATTGAATTGAATNGVAIIGVTKTGLAIGAITCGNVKAELDAALGALL